MSILIKGMKMPKSCDDCRLNNGISCYAVPEYTEDGVVGRTEDRPDWCPLVPVPPHGDLIDRSKLAWTPIDITDLPYRECLPVYLKEDIDDAPIVIESEE